MPKPSKNKKQKRKRKSQPFCSNEIQEDDLEYFKSDIYEVKCSNVFGRYLTAKKNLLQGSIIIEENPLVIGPCQNNNNLICLGCYVVIDNIENCNRCISCKWPICDKKCNGLYKKYGHTKEECKLLSNIPEEFVPSQVNWNSTLYNPITPLRCVILKTKTDQESIREWNQLTNFESHNELRKQIKTIWQLNEETVVKPIREQWGLSELISELELHTICGWLEVNSFSIGINNINLQGLYPTCFLLAHDCISNTTHMDNEDFKMTIRASVTIKKDEAITLSYTNTLQGTLNRRLHLKESKFFDCNCVRCQDPTELGTHFSTMKCMNCTEGNLLPKNSLDNESDWACASCSKITKISSVKAVINDVSTAYGSLKNESIYELENFIQQYSSVLHNNHYLLLNAKYSLSQLYGKMKDYLLQEMTMAQLTRKIKTCEEILNIFDIIEPGLSRIRGVTMYELHAPLFVLTQNQFFRKEISKDEVKNRLQKIFTYLKDATKILSAENVNSLEGQIGIAAKNALEQTKQWKKIVNNNQF